MAAARKPKVPAEVPAEVDPLVKAARLLVELNQAKVRATAAMANAYYYESDAARRERVLPARPQTEAEAVEHIKSEHRFKADRGAAMEACRTAERAMWTIEAAYKAARRAIDGPIG